MRDRAVARKGAEKARPRFGEIWSTRPAGRAYPGARAGTLRRPRVVVLAELEGAGAFCVAPVSVEVVWLSGEDLLVLDESGQDEDFMVEMWNQRILPREALERPEEVLPARHRGILRSWLREGRPPAEAPTGPSEEEAQPEVRACLRRFREEERRAIRQLVPAARAAALWMASTVFRLKSFPGLAVAPPFALAAAALALDLRRPPRRPVAVANKRVPNARSTSPGT